MTDQQQKPTILCISTYEKGQAFIEEVARLGVSVILLTVDKLEYADWPRASISKLVTMPENLTPGQVLNTVSYLARENRFDRIVPLDEFDLEDDDGLIAVGAQPITQIFKEAAIQKSLRGCIQSRNVNGLPDL